MRLLEMSVSAGVLILLIVFVCRSSLWKLSRRAVMLLWMVALARLLLPGSLPIQKGISVPVCRLVQRMCSLRPVVTGHPARGGSADGVPQAASCGQTGFWGADPMQAAGWIWLTGMCCAGVYFFYSYWKEYRLLAQALALESIVAPGVCQENLTMQYDRQDGAENAIWHKFDQMKECCRSACRLAGMRAQGKNVRIFVHDQIRSPLVFGLIRQRIVIPKGLLSLEQAQMQHILTHEMVHIRRYDNLRKLFCAAAVCVHWFNPAVWLMYVLFARDLELCCDEQVLAAYGKQGRQEYAYTLLTLAKNQKKTTLFCSGFWENPVKERIVAIMKYKKLTATGILCAGILFMGATSVFATNEQTAGTKAEANQVNELLTETEIKETPASENDGEEIKHTDTGSVLTKVNAEAAKDLKENVRVTFREPVEKTGLYSYSVNDDGKYILEPLDDEQEYEIQNGEFQETEDGKIAGKTTVDTKLVPDSSENEDLPEQFKENRNSSANTQAAGTKQMPDENVLEPAETVGNTDITKSAQATPNEP